MNKNADDILDSTKATNTITKQNLFADLLAAIY